MNIFQKMADIFAKYHQMIFKGIGYTMLVSIIGTIIGLVIGLLIGVFRTMPTPKNKFLRVLKKVADWILSAYQQRRHAERSLCRLVYRFDQHRRVHGGNRQGRYHFRFQRAVRGRARNRYDARANDVLRRYPAGFKEYSSVCCERIRHQYQRYVGA